MDYLFFLMSILHVHKKSRDCTGDQLLFKYSLEIGIKNKKKWCISRCFWRDFFFRDAELLGKALPRAV